MEVTDLWNEIIIVAITLPKIKANSIKFGQKEFVPYHAYKLTPLVVDYLPKDVLTKSQLNKIAYGRINWHATLVRFTSALFSMPYGLALAATIPVEKDRYQTDKR